MSAEIAIALERLRMSIGERQDRIAESLRAISNAGALAGTGLQIGDRVYDTVSGLEGVVIDGARENVVLPAAK